jgi:hypothetical protein
VSDSREKRYSFARMRRLRIALLAPVLLLAASATVTAQPPNATERVTTPVPGSPTRRAILDALRASLDSKSTFEVHHLRVGGRWAYLRCNEVFFDGDEKQETDLTVAALLERRGEGNGRWTVVERWTLPTDEQEPFKDFVRRVQAKQRAARIPAALFPADY